MNELSTALYEFTKTDKIIFLIFLVAFPGLMLFTSDDSYSVKEFAGLLLMTINSAILVYLVVFMLLKKYLPSKNYLSILTGSLIIMALIVFIEISVYYIFYQNEKDFETPTIITFFELAIMHLLLSGILLGLLMFKKNIDSQILLLKAESLQKANELQVLKAQIDPHFLFNNLNTLDALVDTDVEKAKTYIHRLAQLYQYLLANKDEETVTLATELRFAKDYCYLLKERFGDSYQFNFNGENEKTTHQLIPPGAIQTLFENIVKHNTASFRNPVIVDILIGKDFIQVKNNIQSKKQPTKSYGIGLSNLQTRYRLLSQQNIELEIGDHYTVTLPLLNKLNP